MRAGRLCWPRRGSPFRSVTWCASLAVVLDRCAGDLRRARRLGLDRFTAAVQRELPRWAGSGRACGSSGPCSPRWPTRPGSPRTARRPGTRAPGAGRLAGYPRPARRYRDPDVPRSWMSSGWRTWSPRSTADRHRGRGDPGRDRRPGPVRHRAGPGQARWAVPAQTTPPAPIRARPPISGRGRPGLRVACLAGGLGGDAETTRSWPPGSPT